MDMLDTLAHRLGCICLSDLHFYEGWWLLPTLETLRDRDYPLSDWNETVCYLTGESKEFQSIEEAHQYLKLWMKRR